MNLHITKSNCISILLIIVFLFLSLTGCTKNISPISKTGFAFDTVITITIYDSDDTLILENCFEKCDTYEKLFSATLKGSDIWNINHADGKPVAVSPDTMELITQALYYCKLTDGALDLTVAPVSFLWDFSGKAAQNTEENFSCSIPDSAALSSLLEHVDYHKVQIDGSFVTLTDADASIDLGFIAKGYIADRLKEYLLSEGVQSAIINLGGNILTVGTKPDKSPFKVGIRKPFGAANDSITVVEASDSSVVSSGCYERYFKKDDILYHHILDTASGYPVQNDLLGVTILSDSSLQGDALSTYCYILGLEKGMNFIHSLDHVDAIFITKDYTLHYSDKLD